ncbi:epimerase [Microtetraspora sp. NBRC 13810]|uniref:TIGR01777 family oxidoreductase n=1 Tax=Microtetraspora sp. NBRC 13810 TaxID=3030990 RepID=UPI0024A0D70B|nr:TIGR01777 family oxidoreductase [Microtetraspora sp. NBRC 13810]GLW10576.1 epimerase [Microtetraspora sp. NBRC 13810]
MTIIVTGASGLLGSALVKALGTDGRRVVRLVRRAPRGADESSWDPRGGELDPAVLEGAEAVVHLAGASIGDRRWTATYKNELVRSRVEGTRLLAATLAGLDRPPGMLLSASGIHFYGDTGDRVVDESAAKGTGFLSDMVERWEGETEPAARAGLRVTHLRTSMVLSTEGGPLGRMLPIFRTGLGAPLGSGRQYWSWISIDDWVGAVHHILDNPHETEFTGAVNLTSPTPVTNSEFTTTLGRAIRRPVMPLAVPRVTLRVALGEFADEGILTGPRAIPHKLEETGYRFRHNGLEAALAALL